MNKDQFRQAAGLSVALADRWYAFVEAAMFESAIVSPARASMFIAQVGHESGGFIYTSELWGPTDAQKRYEGRADLGNTQPGDGSRFRGRGLIQITGRSNYEDVSQAFLLDFISDPGQLAEDAYAARSAGWWWRAHGCNEIADTGDIVRLTKRINGGTNGLADRQARYDRAKLFL